VTLLDVATGSADIPLALSRLAERAGWDLRITATDIQPEILSAARAAERPGRIVVERADALALPYESGSFDIVTLAQALHHFEPDDARRALAEMGRVGRRQLIVSDLERSRMGFAGAWLFAHVATRNRMTRNDAPLSVRRAYTAAEARALARDSGWQDAGVRRVAPFRYVLTGRPA
jgi:ubiquinone/menaquinone biosynthesis C-methylase UbiE